MKDNDKMLVELKKKLEQQDIEELEIIISLHDMSHKFYSSILTGILSLGFIICSIFLIDINNRIAISTSILGGLIAGFSCSLALGYKSDLHDFIEKINILDGKNKRGSE